MSSTSPRLDEVQLRLGPARTAGASLDAPLLGGRFALADVPFVAAVMVTTARGRQRLTERLVSLRDFDLSERWPALVSGFRAGLHE